MGGDRSEHRAQLTNCCLFEKQTFQYFHTNLTTTAIIPSSLSWYLNCVVCWTQVGKMVRRAVV